jgi:hypothetical protein
MSQFKLPAPAPETKLRMQQAVMRKRREARAARGGTYHPALVRGRVRMVFHPD